MTIDDAIKILDAKGVARLLYGNQQVEEALKLGIEALQAIKQERKGNPSLNAELLPGETWKKERR